jgi:hypothetical protein
MPSAAEQSVMRLYALTNFMASIGLGSACGYDVPGNAITELSVFWIDSLLLVRSDYLAASGGQTRSGLSN